MSKERITYKQTFKKGAATIKKELLPETLPYLHKGSVIVAMELLEAGTLDRDGDNLEYQVVRVLVHAPG